MQCLQLELGEQGYAALIFQCTTEGWNESTELHYQLQKSICSKEPLICTAKRVVDFIIKNEVNK